jgi:pimeloyl-ACP methyl ester carboxylesterase
MPWIDRDGVRIRYDVTGGGDGTPLLLSHGYGASRAMWAPNLAALTAGRTVITWDMRGHGDSDSPDEQSSYSHDASVADMAAILDACDVETAAVGGLSLGGYMSLAFYREHPKRVHCLLLFDTGPGFKNDESRRRWNEQAEATAARYEQQGLSALSSSPEVARGRHDPMGLARAARGMLAQQDGAVIASLRDVTSPTLVLVGADDTGFLAAADYMARTIADAEKVVLPGAGHAANIDQPEAFNAAVTSFLDRH